MALTASRTLAKVNSSAITPRQPEVPNLMGEVIMNRYSSLTMQKTKAVRAVYLGQGREAMKAGGRNRVVLVTCATLNESRKIARGVLQKRLAACVNVLLGPI